MQTASRSSIFGRHLPPAGPASAKRTRCACVRPLNKVSLVRPVVVDHPDSKPLLLYLPGTDGTGNSIVPQLPGLVRAGFDIRSLYITMDDRSSWEGLTSQVVTLVKQLTQTRGPRRKFTLVAESFGGCLAFRLALAVPDLIANMVVVNSATCFDKSYSGIVNLIAASNLLSLFPEQLYQVAQAVLVPLLVDKEKVGPSSLRAIKSMMVMQPPPSFQIDGGQVGVAGPPAGAVQQSKTSDALYLPSATASWRMNMLTDGNLSDAFFRQIKLPVLLVGSGQDRLLPSLTEQTRLQRLLPNARRLVLPDSGHTALLEADVDLVSIMKRTGFLPSDPLQPGATTLVSQGGSQIGQVRGAEGGSASNGALQKKDTTKGGRQDTASSSRAATARVGAATRANQPATASNNGSTAVLALQEQIQQSRAVEAQQPVSTNRAASSSSNGQYAASALSAAAQSGSNGSRSNAGASTSATATVEGWVSNNLTAFVADPASGPDPQISSSPSASSSSATQKQSDKQQPAGLGRNGVNVEARQSWAAAKQEGPPGAWHGSGQGCQGGSGGSWTHVDDQMEDARRFLAPWRALVSPVVKGVENLPDPLGPRRPLLFIGNHTLLGLYDLPLLVHELYLRGYKVRGLAHPGHWKTPLGPLFQSLGAVKASPMAAYRLLQNAEAVLLFPGGGREVNKRKGEKYKLIWKDKPDFVRMAAKSNALIIPFAAVGGDDAFDIAMDTDEVLANPVLGPLARRVSQQVFKGSPLEGSDDAITPITKLPGLGLPSLVPLPKLERLYFRFMPPVDAQVELPDRSDTAAAEALYGSIKATVEQGIRQAQQDREADPERQLGKRLLGQVQRVVPSWELLADQGVSRLDHS